MSGKIAPFKRELESRTRVEFFGFFHNNESSYKANADSERRCSVHSSGCDGIRFVVVGRYM